MDPTLKRNKPGTKIPMNALKRDVEQHSDAQRAERLRVSQRGMCHTLKRLGVSYTKNATLISTSMPIIINELNG